ncbi:MAG: hypothetical protein CYG60_24765 [Actinobacteria bacterium]|nr:MAG: hypothetical protein CYG60_24765 [Actinomycetota bacterium]
MEMPFWRFFKRRERLKEQLLDEEKRWMLGQWMQARTLYAALTSDKDLPPTKAEHEGKKRINWAKLEEARQQRLLHDKRWMQALSDPREFGAYMGMPHILGEPEKKKKPKAGVANLTEKFASRLDRALGKAG